MGKSIEEMKKANLPAKNCSTLLPDADSVISYEGFVDRQIRFIENFGMKDASLWQRFADQFRLHTDDVNAGWRGEYWGKMMRGACFTYSYTRDEALYQCLSDTVETMMNIQEESGRISTYSVEKEFDGWDLWARKYVLLGMEYYLEICKEPEQIKRVVDSMRRQLDYIITYIGSKEDGKKPITEATRHWRGINSVSILEPVVRLYRITGRQEYFDFAEYIVGTGGTSVENVFQLAYEDELYPYQYPVTKAYETTSAFEGLLEFYRVTGEEKYKKAVIRFAYKILESDFTVIGCCGCTHELFDHSTVRQANTDNGRIMQETCVTVTLMKFFWQLNVLTGKASYVDAFERSLYNAYFGAVNTEHAIGTSIYKTFPDVVIEPLPFDSYSPLTAGCRGNGIGGLQLMPDGHYYGCCACIGAAGMGLIPKMALLRENGGIVMNLYIPGQMKTRTPGGAALEITTATEYPKEGEVVLTLHLQQAETFRLHLRIPSWSKEMVVIINGEQADIAGKLQDGYLTVEREWKEADEISLTFDMRTEAIYPIPYGHQVLMNKVVWGYNYIVPAFDREDPAAKYHIALRRGPIMLAVENRLDHNVEEPYSIAVGEDGYVEAVKPIQDTAPYEHIVEMQIPQKDGGYFTVTDYASAGKLWNEESKMAVWIRTGESF